MRPIIICAIMLCAVMIFVSCTKEEPEAAKYSVTVEANDNGTTTLSVTDPVEEGTEVTLTATPNEGYSFKQWAAISSEGTVLNLDDTTNPTTFTMPAADISIKVEFDIVDVIGLIPDPEFKKYAKKRLTEKQVYRSPQSGIQLLTDDKWDTDGNGKLSLEEAAAAKAILLRVGSLSGLEYFTGLEHLDFSFSNEITEVDLSNHTKLQTLITKYCHLTELDVTNNTEIVLISVSYNKLRELDISRNRKIEILECDGNMLQSLDASAMVINNDGIFYLYCGNQTLNGTTPQPLALTLDEEQRNHWETSLEENPFNSAVVVTFKE